jgi:hypothetical protein
VTVTLRQGWRHELIPGCLIASLSQVFQDDEVALGVHCHQTKAARKRFVLSHGDVCAGHVFGQAGGFGVAVGGNRFFNLTVDLWLSPIGGRDKAVKPRQVEDKTGQAHAACPDFDAHEVDGHHQPV